MCFDRFGPNTSHSGYLSEVNTHLPEKLADHGKFSSAHLSTAAAPPHSPPANNRQIQQESFCVSCEIFYPRMESIDTALHHPLSSADD